MISKVTLRDEIKKFLIKDMLTGKVKPGSRLSLAEISTELAVSVTPVREALSQLTESGVIDYVPNRGFIVPVLNETEAIEIYEVIAALEVCAVEGIEYSKSDFLEIDRSQSKFLRAKGTMQRVKYDMAFHRSLIMPCRNELLKKLIEDVRIRVFFYELNFMDSDDLKGTSENDHETIIKLLKNGKKALAAQTIKKNWTQSIDQVLTEIKVL